MNRRCAVRYAMNPDAALPDLHMPTKAYLERAMHGHVLSTAEQVGMYQKHKR